MTDPKEKLYRELAEYIAMEDNLNSQDRLLILKAIVDKHFISEKALHLITEGDIFLIGSFSKKAYGDLVLPLYIGDKRVEYDDLRTIAMIEAFISYMNLNHLAKREIQINYKRGK